MVMFHRFRMLAAGCALILSFGVGNAGASVPSSARISAHLTSTSFAPAKARTVKLVYKFSSRSSRFAFVLTRKAGSAWSRVRSLSKRGSFRGSHTMTVKRVFGSKPVLVGRYRLKVSSSSAQGVTLGFTVVSPGTSPVTPPATPPATVKPEAGSWRATAMSGPVSGDGTGFYVGFHVTATSISFTVSPDGTTVTGFGFTYDMSGPGTTPGSRCSQSGSTADQTSGPITDGQFSTPDVNTWTDPFSYGTFSGTFDSPTAAHGTAWLHGYIGAFDCSRSGYASTGTFSWTASRQP